MRLRLSLLTKTLAAVALVCALLAPAGAAAGSTSASVKMDVVPLPQWAIGAVAKPLQLSQLSGVVSSSNVASQTLEAPGEVFTAYGFVSGYMLDYGHPRSGGSGITDVRTSIEQYKTKNGAKRVLGFWRQEGVRMGSHLSHGGLSVRSTRVKVPALGKARIAYLTIYKAANIAPLATLDERIVEGKYLLQAQVSAGTATAAKALALKLAKKLDIRFKLALKGHLHAKPVPLPAKRAEAGPPVGGPELSAFALTTADLGGEAKVDWAGYCPCGEVADYEIYMSSAGSFGSFHQAILWFPTANEAAFWTDLHHAHLLGHDWEYKDLDVSSVGHGAQGVTPVSTGDAATVWLNVGQLVDEIGVLRTWNTDPPIQRSDVLTLAQTAANRIDAVYTP